MCVDCHAGLFTGDDRVARAGAGDAYADANGDAAGDRDSDTLPLPHRYEDGNAATSHVHEDAYTHAHGESYGHAHGDRYADRHAHAGATALCAPHPRRKRSIGT